MDQPKSPETRVATIKLDEGTRKHILSELGVQASIDWLPEVIHVTRLHSSAVSAVKLTRPNRWVLVMV